LNKALLRSHFQIPTIEEILPEITNAKIFIVIDAKDVHWQIMRQAATSPQFGRLKEDTGVVRNKTGEYQRGQHEALHDLRGVRVIADDILVYGCGNSTKDAMADHDKNISALLQRAMEDNLMLNRKKLRLRLPSVMYMGHLLTNEGSLPNQQKITAVKTWKHLTM